ncbi:hypothetical protein AAFF_G00211160 [Aldrovandia affinis]|uniref:Uncharacterized protein n=1 Tax=Aldrovandia affinis TaxID=143900 RepID=A0AAD7SWN1_9TELE|nr:hypothetical protein AAFF_G00211160 [Aldrovandia affinis]
MDMEELNSVVNMDTLIFQLALQTQELSKNKDDVVQQIGMLKLNVAKKKTRIQETKISIEKLQEARTQKENLVRYYKDSAKSLRVTNNLLLQYEKTLQVELQRKQVVFRQDGKMYQERIENYKKIFEQHKARYCENPLVHQLIKAQREKEDIEQRIGAFEEQIVAKERELQSLQGNIPNPSTDDSSDSDSVQSTDKPQEQVDPQTEEGASAQIETSISSHLIDTWQNSSLVAEEENDGGEEEEETMNMAENQDEETPREESTSSSSSVDTDHTITWENREDEGQLQGLSQEQTAETEGQEESLEEVFGAVGAEQREGGGDMQKPLSVSDEEENEEEGGYPHTPPARMKAVQNTPTFSLNSSPGHSPGLHKTSECKSPAFMFSMNTTPETPTFSGFGCSFNRGSLQDEDLPFSFTSSFFDKKSESKSPGFMDQMESRPEEDFQLFFSTKSPTQTSDQEQVGGNDDFSFFNFGKV